MNIENTLGTPTQLLPQHGFKLKEWVAYASSHHHFVSPLWVLGHLLLPSPALGLEATVSIMRPSYARERM